jgi:hypothetical protein
MECQGIRPIQWQRQVARPQAKKQQLKPGALVFVQFFGSALQLTPLEAIQL